MSDSLRRRRLQQVQNDLCKIERLIGEGEQEDERAPNPRRFHLLRCLFGFGLKGEGIDRCLFGAGYAGSRDE